MKYVGLLAAALPLILLSAAPAADTDVVGPLPGFPNIRSNAQVLEPLGKDNKPLLKIVRADYDAKRYLIIWLLELQADIGFDEKLAIDRQWFDIYGSVYPSGPSAIFFDNDGVAIAIRDLKRSGKLYEGKKGDRIRMILELPKDGLPGVATVDIRHP